MLNSIFLALASLTAALGFALMVVHGHYQGGRPAWGLAAWACWGVAVILLAVQVVVWVKAYLVDRG